MRPQPRHRAPGRAQLPTPDISVGRGVIALPLAAVLSLSGMAISSAAWTSAGTGSGSAAAGTLSAPAVVTAAQANTGSSTVSVSWSSVSNAARYEVYRSGTATPVAVVTGLSYSDTLPADGSYTYRVVARVGSNWVGTSSAPSNVVTYVAAPGKPTVAAFSSDSGVSGDGYTNVAAQTITGSATTGSTVTVTQNGTPIGSVTAAGGTFSVSATLAAGANTFVATASNAGGSSVASDPFVVHLDQTNPLTAYDTASKRLTVTENGSGTLITYFKVDSAAYAEYKQQEITVGSGSTLSFYSEDKAGNREPVKTYTPAAADTTPPTTDRSISGTPGTNGWYTSSIGLTLTATDRGNPASGVKRIEYSTNEGQSWSTYTAALSFTAEGTRTVLYRAVDNRDNVEAAQSVEIKIDLTNPSITANLASSTNGVDKYTLSATDTPPGVLSIEYRVTSKNKTPAYAAYTPGTEIGVNGGDTLEYRVTDSSGRVGIGSVTK